MYSFEVLSTPCAFVTQQHELDEMVEQLAAARLLAVDTEFVRTNTFYPRVGLLQIASPECCFLVDPLQGLSLQGLQALLFAEPTRLIMHACSEDLEVLLGLFGDLPATVFDTQIAASMVSRDQQLGLQKLILNYCGVEIPKDETRSDWTKRPLTENQMRYAALDVVCLLKVYAAISEKLLAEGRMSWCEEECRRLVDSYRREAPIEDYYRTMGDAWKLSGKKLVVLKALATWREQMARQLDKPRGFIFSDRELFAIADKLPQSLSQLVEVGDFKPVQIRRYGEEVLKVAEQALSGDEESLPRVPKPFNNAVKKVVKAIKPVLEKRAVELDMATDRLSNRRNLEKLVKAKLEGNSLPDYYQGWRQTALLPTLEQALQDYQKANSD